ncbi:extracellular solute-binding protein [Microbispora sp. H10830]|uniref:extracellular solute-binding protein n=1 Tax=Microbispora sp. H10830 TaxID=2729109 RepID=UPI0016024331|nr:extracellular solute-binding protein [Microbispora sp. H10830]
MAAGPLGAFWNRWYERFTRFHLRLAAACFLAGAVFVIGVSQHSGSSPSQNACPGRPDDLVIGTGAEIGAGGVRHDVIKAWNDEQRKLKKKPLKATLVEISESSDEQRSELAAAAQSKRCAYDVLLLDVAYMTEFARNHYLETFELDPKKLGGTPERYFLRKSLGTGQVDGERFAVPFAADAPLLYRRTDTPAPPPQDTKKFLELAKEHGYAAQFDDYEGGTVNLLEAIFSAQDQEAKDKETPHGPVVFDDKGNVVLDEGDNGKRVMDALGAWREALFTVKDDKRTLRDESVLREESSLQAFRTGRVGYMRNWPFAFNRLAADPLMRDDDGSLRFQVLSFPGTGVLGGVDLAIAKDSPHKEEARDLIYYLVSEDVQERLFACAGYPPVVAALYERYERSGTARTCGDLAPDPADGGARPAERDTEITGEQLARFAGEVHQAVDHARPRPMSAYYATFSQVFRSCLLPVATTTSGVAPDFRYFSDALRDALNGRLRSDDPCHPPTQAEPKSDIRG